MGGIEKIGAMVTISGLILAGLSRFPILFTQAEGVDILHGGGLVIAGIGFYIYCIDRNK